MCLYCEYVVFDFEFFGFVFDFEFSWIVFNFEFFFRSNFEFFQGKKKTQNFFFLFKKKPIAAFLKCSYRRL